MALRPLVRQAAHSRLVDAALCACALSAFAAGARAQEVPTFSSQIDVVKLDVSVTRGTRPVEGLRASDFEVLDNGVRQQVELLGHEQAALEALLLLDTSQSVAGPKLAALKTAVGRFVDGLGPGDHAALVTFARQVRWRAEAGDERAPLLAAVDQVTAGGTTSLCDAVLLGLVELQPRERRPVLVVFSDGADFLSWLTPEEVQEASRRSDAVVYVVSTPQGAVPGSGIAGWSSASVFRPLVASRTWLEDLALASGGAVFMSDERRLTDAFLGVLSALKSRYVLRYEPTGVAAEGWHTLKVRTPRVRGVVGARQGYFARR
jgi:VWFA-related protein